MITGKISLTILVCEKNGDVNDAIWYVANLKSTGCILYPNLE